MSLNQRSIDRLVGVHAHLVAIVTRAAQLLAPVEFIVTEGVRTLARQKELYAKGRTKPGPKVTDTMHSRHLTGHAVDLCPLQANGTIDWNDREGFDAVYKAMMIAADEYGFPLRSGMDWDRDGNKREKGEYDSPHYELPATDYPA
jgi:peptidoglycan L-alanyl-D-glutamate endopeptidase CwlK